MKLYNFARAPNGKRVNAFLAAKGLAVDCVAVDLIAGEQRSPEFLARNPRGEIPLLELDDGTCIAESVAICRYLERLHPEPALFGSSHEEEALVEMWNRRLEFGLFRSVADYFQHTLEFFRDRVRQVPEYAEASRASAIEALSWLDAQLGERPYVAGERYSIADITAQVAIDLGTPTLFETGSAPANIARWLECVRRHPSAAAIHQPEASA
ncbi:MAG: glutathione S-transferase N-terminal domain-containing protein [Pseudomonadales bacterium]